MKEATNLTIYTLYLSYCGNSPYRRVFFSLEALEEFKTRLPDDTEIREQETTDLREPFYRAYTDPWTQLEWNDEVLRAGSLIESYYSGASVRCYTIESLMSAAKDHINKRNEEMRKRGNSFWKHHYD
ncbi:hypothetical protein [Pectobacterium versatile]|uniref:hypothetical protein n=1 Tax=Pectobacterium versatile TaxID=2488639 RepID=UPI001F270E3D|nr:hypothetical protein [Pectobacterium versatile]